jgi:acyl-CoA reductase-like NAD-dependent aldehyde dehydrogenase
MTYDMTPLTQRGREVAQILASRFGKSILELGGNNAMIVDKSANIGDTGG